MTRARRRAGAAALLAAAVSMAGCGVTQDEAARPLDPVSGLADPTTTTSAAPEPAPTTQPTTTTTVAPTTAATLPPTETVRFFYVVGDRLRAEYKFVPVGQPGARIDPAQTLDQLAAGPSGGLANLFERAMVDDIRVDRGRAEVWLGEPFLALSPPAQLVVVAQLVLTLTDRPGIGRVVFRTATEAEVAVPRPDGSAGSGDTTAEDYRALLEP